MHLSELVEKIAKTFNISELHDLCLRLDIDYEDLSGENRRDKVVELVNYCKRRRKLNELVTLCGKLRPNESWELDKSFPSKLLIGDNPKINFYLIFGVLVVGSILGFLLFSTLQGESVNDNSYDLASIYSTIAAQEINIQNAVTTLQAPNGEVNKEIQPTMTALALQIIELEATREAVPTSPLNYPIDNSVCHQLRMLFLIDQSASTIGYISEDGNAIPPSDPLGIRYYSVQHAIELLSSLRYQAFPESIINVAVVSFGTDVRLTMPWTPITPENVSDHQQLMQEIDSFLEPSAESLGETLFLPPFQMTKTLFDQANCASRYIVLITDGKPTTNDISNFNWKEHMEELVTYIHNDTNLNNSKIFVVGFEAEQYWSDIWPYWVSVTRDESRVFRANSLVEVAAFVSRIVNEAARDLPRAELE